MYFLLILIILTLIFFVSWLFFSQKVIQIKREEGIPIRGILKYYAQNKIEESNKLVIVKWLILSFFASLIPCLWIIFFTWGTDHSFWIGLFSIFWFYWLTRMLLWEKSDISSR